MNSCSSIVGNISGSLLSIKRFRSLTNVSGDYFVSFEFFKNAPFDLLVFRIDLVVLNLTSISRSDLFISSISTP